MSNCENVFSQWKNVVEVVMTPRFGNRSHRRTNYMVPAYTEKHEVTEKAMQQCLHDLAHVARNNEERNLAFLFVDRWRNTVPWPKWYDAIHEAFSYSGTQIRIMEYYYLSLTLISICQFPGNILVLTNCMLVSFVANRRRLFKNSPCVEFPGSVPGLNKGEISRFRGARSLSLKIS